jgi:hypothetical protein
MDAITRCCPGGTGPAPQPVALKRKGSAEVKNLNNSRRVMLSQARMILDHSCAYAEDVLAGPS